MPSFTISHACTLLALMIAGGYMSTQEEHKCSKVAHKCGCHAVTCAVSAYAHRQTALPKRVTLFVATMLPVAAVWQKHTPVPSSLHQARCVTLL